MKIAKVLVLGAAFAASAQADERMPQHIGVSGGAALGALIAGPVGMAVGATIGNFAGLERIQSGRLVATEQALTDSQTQLASLELTIADRRQELAELQQALDRQTQQVTALKGLVQEIPIAVTFESKSAELKPDYQSRLAAVATALQAVPDAAVQLTGHADQRGDSHPNQALSEARAAMVGTQLIDAGAPAPAIQWAGQGESAATGDHAWDRRVDLSFDFGAPSSTLFSAN